MDQQELITEQEIANSIQEAPRGTSKSFLKIFFVVLIIVVALGTGGYFLAKQNNKTLSSLFTVTPVATPTPSVIPTSTPTPTPERSLLSPTQTKTPTPTPAQHIYKDTYLGYSISYPFSWIFRKTYGPDIQKQAPTDVKSGIDLTNNTTLNGQTMTQATIVVNVLDRHNASDIQTWISQYDLNYPKNATKQAVTFNGFSAIKYNNFLQGSYPTEYLYFLSGSYAYRIQYWEQAGISEETRAVIASFKP
ncbi:MAG TPA: hypothetical protein VFQ63_01690 [Patescibacteria group bacterium]|nr:hypothetical protein [Patescibacteria group bacterium]